VQAPGQPETLREGLGRVVQARGQLVEHGGVGVEGVFDGGAEQVLLGGEVVVEGPDSDVGGLGDLHDWDLRRPGGEEGLGRTDERGAGARFAPVQAVGCPGGLLGHACSPLRGRLA
jgi:hypothetical protein